MAVSRQMSPWCFSDSSPGSAFLFIGTSHVGQSREGAGRAGASEACLLSLERSGSLVFICSLIKQIVTECLHVPGL